ncbi:MAG: 3-keto-disaccharide hydrolase [Bryobacteraceae bacterium]
MRYRNRSGTWRIGALVIVICVCSSPTLLLRLHSGQTAEHPAPAQRSPVPALEETGFRSIFDGNSLGGWDGNPEFWSVKDGAIVGQSTREHQPKQNTFCIWKGGQPRDFEFKAEYRITGVNDGNSGIQYRSVELPDIAKWVMKGYQADIDLKQQYTGQIYEERARGFLALRGQISYVPDGRKAGSIGSVGTDTELRSFIKDSDWNEIHIVARGNVLIQLINGHVMSTLIDDDSANRKMQGEIGIQLHRLPNAAMKIETRHIRLKPL